MSDPLVTVKTLGQATKKLMRECEEDGIDPLSPDGAKVIAIWLNQKTGHRCLCGAEMKRHEGLNGKCDKCREGGRRRSNERTGP